MLPNNKSQGFRKAQFGSLENPPAVTGALTSRGLEHIGVTPGTFSPGARFVVSVGAIRNGCSSQGHYSSSPSTTLRNPGGTNKHQIERLAGQRAPRAAKAQRKPGRVSRRV
jgi:hypothetical protein